MPIVEADGFYNGKVIDASFDLQYKSFKVFAEIADGPEVGKHAYPAVYLENKAGGRNEEAFEMLKELYGWSGISGQELIDKAKSVGKVRFSKKGKYFNFVKPRGPKKASAPAADVDAWLAGLNGGGSIAGGDLAIGEENIPFAPIY